MQDGVVLPSIPSSTYKWLFGLSISDDCINASYRDDHVSEKRVHTLLEDGNIDKLPGPNWYTRNAFEWNLELIRDGIESVIQVTFFL